MSATPENCFHLSVHIVREIHGRLDAGGDIALRCPRPPQSGRNESRATCESRPTLRRPARLRFFLPLPATQEWGEDRGEGLLQPSTESSSSPRPSPPSDGGDWSLAFTR